ncbi:MAG: nuclear transport factor 2 family protein [Thermoleophilaceae bacterium]
MTAHEQIEIVSRGYEALNGGDIDAVVGLVHPEFAWTDPPDVVGARGGVGRNDFALYLRSFGQAWDEFRCEPEEFRIAGDALVVIVRESGRGKISGATVEHRLVHVWRFDNGRAVSLEAYAAEALAA